MHPLLILLIASAIVAVGVLAWLFWHRPKVAAPTRLSDRLSLSREALGAALRGAFSGRAMDDGFWDTLEEALIGVDVGVVASKRIVERVRKARPGTPAEAGHLLKIEVRAALGSGSRQIRRSGSPSVVMVVGVNGTGKTTSIAKLAHFLEGTGSTTLLGAADTFRAAAGSQLMTWANRVGVEMVGGQEGADPAAVAFDAFQAARSRHKDFVIIDTAGRLHSKQNLMSELAKIQKVVEREAGEIAEVLLVLDATAGQNGVIQAKRFFETAGVSGIVLTKLDGTARGGIVVAIEEELGIPVKFIGVGEGVEDLVAFDPDAFVEALLEAS